MNIKTIYEDDKIIVKSVWYMGKFLYTKTYFLNDDGFEESSVTVWSNGGVTTTGTVMAIKER